MQTVVDISRIRQNIRKIRSRTGVSYCAVVKADAYGHGVTVAGCIEPVVDCFMVATPAEAYELIGCVHKPILVLGGEILPLLHDVQQQIVPTACDLSQLKALVAAGYKRFSVAINTGMNRLGANGKTLEAMTEYCAMLNIMPWSVYSHIYGGIHSVPEQAQLFEELTAAAVLRNKRHLYCSLALDLKGYDLFDMVRCGIAMYGYSAITEPCLKARAKIVAINYVHAGEHIGYGDCVLDADALIATVRCGYADGVRRVDNLYFKVRGNKCAVIGSPCMDLTMIDITRVPAARIGEYAYFIDGREDAEHIAKCYGTIVYEVLTGLDQRAERIYV